MGHTFFYNEDWVREVIGQDRWQAIALFAHELGHFLNAHFTDRADIPKKQKEEETDRFAGCAVARRGGEWPVLEDLLSRIRREQDELYPNRLESLDAARRGFDDCNGVPPEPKVETRALVYSFPGSFKVARYDNDVVFSLTEGAVDKNLRNKKIWVDKISFNAKILDESDEFFGFDQEILIFSSSYRLMAPNLHNKDYTKFISLHDGYAPERRRLALTSRTDDGRAVKSATPISWIADLPDGSVTQGDIWSIKSSAIDVGESGLYIQLLLWTLWGGSHYVELSNPQLSLGPVSV